MSEPISVSFAVKQCDLVPCRNCGSLTGPHLLVNELEPVVQCFNCGEPGPRCDTEEQAVETWNRKQGDPMTTFDSGAKRSSDAEDVRYDLISPIGLRRLAETYAEGAKKYGAGNWLNGFPATNLVNHLMRHVDLFRSGDASEDHLAHAAWGLFTLMHFSETRPDLMDVSFERLEAKKP